MKGLLKIITPGGESGTFLKAKPGITIQTGRGLSGVFLVVLRIYKLLTHGSAWGPNSSTHKERLVLYLPTKGNRLWGSLRTGVIQV